MNISYSFSNVGSCATSFSTYATIQVTKFRDKHDEYGRAQEMGCPEMAGRAVAAELAFVLLAVVSVVETLARAILSLVAVPVALVLYNCCEQRDLAEKIGMASIGGAIFSAQNVANCFAALIANCSCNGFLYYEELIPCMQEYNDQIPETNLCGCEN
jgi:hypothetical protein